MQKISNFIFHHSPKKLAIYLVLGPLVLFLIHTITTIALRNIAEISTTNHTLVQIILGILAFCLGVLLLLWLFWLRTTVYAVNETEIGLTRKWFRIAYAVFWFFIVFNLTASIFEYLIKAQNRGDNYMYLIYTSREYINFSGIIIAYPIVCHYAARAATSKRNKKPATFIDSLPFTLFLIFGTVLGIPFLHKYFSAKNSSNSEIVVVYAIALGLSIILFVLGFIAAITGLV